MKVITICLTFGNRPDNIIKENLSRGGYYNEFIIINKEGIANALNDGIDYMLENNYDAVAFLANDIIEPQDWLKKKVEALQTYPNAGVVSSSIHEVEKQIRSQLIISNYLISRSTVEKIGYFQESMFPYGPIDLDYCQRCAAAGIGTYYVIDCLAIHEAAHATGTEYGWDKGRLVSEGMGKIYSTGDFYLNRL